MTVLKSLFVVLLNQVKASDEAVSLCKTSIGSLKLDINDLPATKVIYLHIFLFSGCGHIYHCIENFSESNPVVSVGFYMIWNLSKYKMLPKFVITPLLFPQTIIHVVLCIIHLQKLIEEVEEMLNNLPGVTSVHGRFYDLSSKYYRIIGNHAMYYKDALRYLGCVEAKDLPGKYSDCWMFTFDKILVALQKSR